jgi:hypothetical protein
MKQITVPSGIGDNIWIIQKLISLNQKFDWVLPNGKPQRGKQVFDLLPQITNSCKYSPDPRINYRSLAQKNIQKRINTWSKITQRTICLSANEHLEQGKRLDLWLYDLPLTYELPWVTNSEVKLQGVNIGIYGSSYSTTRAWNFWNEKEWLELIKSIHKIRKDVTFCLIGAEWDLDLNGGIVKELEKEKIKYLNTCGKPLGYVIELMKQLDYAFYFPSGLPILSETLKGKRDCVMFYPPHLKKMMGSWCDPKRKDTNFKEVQFCEPSDIFNWVKNDYKLFDKI